MQRIERAPVIPISRDPHFEDYAEMPNIMETWDEKTERRMRRDEEAEALFWLAICLGIVFCICAWWPR